MCTSTAADLNSTSNPAGYQSHKSANSPLFTGPAIQDTTLVNAMAYGDCTSGSLMMAGGGMCMAGEPTGGSMMAGTPWVLEITQAAVPVPAAIWLFGGALMTLLGANRRKPALAA